MLSSPLTVGGTVKGPASGSTPAPEVSGALVSFFSLDSSGHSVLLGSALTDSKGVYSTVLPDVQQPGTSP